MKQQAYLTPQTMYLIICIFSLIIILSQSITIEQFSEVNGYKFDFQSLRSYNSRSKLKCVIQCLQENACESVNILKTDNIVQCDMQTLATQNREYLLTDGQSIFICKYKYDS